MLGFVKHETTLRTLVQRGNRWARSLASGIRPGGPGTAAIAFRLFRGAEGLAQIRDDWEAVCRTMRRPRYFHCFPWHQAYARTLFEDPASLRFFVAYSDGVPVAIFPLYARSRVIGGMPVQTLGFPVHSHLPICDFVFDRSATNSGLAAAFVEYLRREQPDPWDVLCLDGVLEDSAVWFSLLCRPAAQMIRYQGPVCDYLDSTPFDERLQKMSKSFRAALRKARNKLAAEAGVEFVQVVCPGEIASALEEFFDVEASGWKRAAGTAIKSNARLVAFYREVGSGFGASHRTEINLLRVGGKCVAGQFCLRTGHCLHVVKIGYDEAYSRLAPGNMLLENVVRRSLSEGEVDSINLLSNTAWHGDWKPQSYARHEVFLFNHSLRGQAAYIGLRTKDVLTPFYRQHVKPLFEPWFRTKHGP
jgi:CelD/BcsL family acetyltransferase involved in cellulose biosynthesis